MVYNSNENYIMAILHGKNLDLNLKYKGITNLFALEYYFAVEINNKSFINPLILKEQYRKNGMVFDLDEKNDILIDFFRNVFLERKGRIIRKKDFFDFSISIEAITWNEKKIEKEKQWEGKTVVTKENENSELKIEPCQNVMNELFVPIFENQIEFILEIDANYFDLNDNKTSTYIHLETTFDDLGIFLVELMEEQKEFRQKGNKCG